jgi:PAS domain S-box-containing protein
VWSPGGELLGTVSVYCRRARRPRAAELQALERCTRLAALAIERRRAELALRESEQRFSLFMRHLPGLAFLKDEQHRMVYLNPAFERVFGAPAGDWLGKTIDQVLPAEAAGPLRANDEWVLRHEAPLQIDERIELSDGVHHYLTFRFPILRSGRPPLLGGGAIDLTEHKRVEAERERLEAELRQSQKMEALGQLAGAVAHDFNNILTVIVGNAEMLLQPSAIAGPDLERQALEQIQTAGQRATALTRQLLAFSRKQVVEPEVLDLNRTIAEIQGMLQRLVGEDVAFDLELRSDVPQVMIDHGQLNQLLVNLVLMYASLTVCDDGVGMDREVLSHIFEPFYTTKPPGKGTGLGLSTVYGIVKQAGGDIHVRSALHRGSSFEVLLPQARAAAAPRPAPRPSPAPGSGEVILM